MRQTLWRRALDAPNRQIARSPCNILENGLLTAEERPVELDLEVLEPVKITAHTPLT